VRLLERWLIKSEGLTSDQALQRLRFHNSLLLGFAPSEVAELRLVPHKVKGEPKDGIKQGAGSSTGSSIDSAWAPNLAAAGEALPDSRTLASIDVTPAFIGLLGSSGTLPNFYTELFAEREQVHKDGAGRAFMDIFLQRTATLLYQAWRKHRIALRFEQDRQRHFTPILLAIAGVGQDALRERLQAPDGGIADDTLAYFAGRLQQRPVSMACVQQVIARYFSVSVKVEQFVGKWYELGMEHQTSLGLQASGLGQNALVGARVWQRDQRVRLTLGPLTRQQLQRFLPGQSASKALKHWLQLLTGLSLEYEIRLCLKANEVQPCVLGSQASAPQLGYDSFLVTQAQNHDRFEPGYDLFSAA
jgi:type VI secretion system protein ImpH